MNVWKVQRKTAAGTMLSAAFKDAPASQVCLIAKLVRDLAKHSKHEYL